MKIAVLGDPLLDVWVEGAPLATADGPGFLAGEVVVTPGGAANAARQLARHPGVQVALVGPADAPVRSALAETGVDLELASWCPRNPEKLRYVAEDGRVLFRADAEPAGHGLSWAELTECRDLALKAVRNGPWDAVLLADYGKRFFDEPFARRLVRACRERGLPVVADPKHPPGWFEGATLKCNAAYAAAHHLQVLGRRHPAVVTHGPLPPLVLGEAFDDSYPGPPPVRCVNHVGAGDCFAAHLALALALQNAQGLQSLGLGEAARYAHAAGRVYVQHPRGRPPWPFEVAADLDPATGKVLGDGDLPALRAATAGKAVVFTNGVFRVPHPGHAWLLRWARARGDVLVVGVNDDASAARVRPEAAWCLPLAARLEWLTGLACVDWVVPFGQDTPEDIIEALRPDVLVKGNEYRGRRVPGDEAVGQVLFAPEGPHPWHATDLDTALRHP